MDQIVKKLDSNRISRVWRVRKTVYSKYDGQIMSLGECKSIEDARYWVQFIRNLTGKEDGN